MYLSMHGYIPRLLPALQYKSDTWNAGASPHAPCLIVCRGRDDKTGYEPRGLFNVVEFVMNDKKGNGFISLEEAMQVRTENVSAHPVEVPGWQDVYTSSADV